MNIAGELKATEDLIDVMTVFTKMGYFTTWAENVHIPPQLRVLTYLSLLFLRPVLQLGPRKTF